jgi:hypothetical protein
MCRARVPGVQKRRGCSKSATPEQVPASKRAEARDGSASERTCALISSSTLGCTATLLILSASSAVLRRRLPDCTGFVIRQGVLQARALWFAQMKHARLLRWVAATPFCRSVGPPEAVHRSAQPEAKPHQPLAAPASGRAHSCSRGIMRHVPQRGHRALLLAVLLGCSEHCADATFMSCLQRAFSLLQPCQPVFGAVATAPAAPGGGLDVNAALAALGGSLAALPASVRQCCAALAPVNDAKCAMRQFVSSYHRASC